MSTPARIVDETPVDSDEQPHWVSQAAFPILSLALALSHLVLWYSLFRGAWWPVVPLILVISHLSHGQLIAFHEASHGLLRKNRRLNDFDGLFIGTFSFISFTLYRAAHQTHHMHLSSERDEELWPFVQPGTPRAFRILAAFLELSFGLLFTPFLFLRTFLRKGSPIRSPRVRRRIWAEFAFMAAIWGILLGLVAWQGWWKYFLCMYLAPSWIAGNLQSWRKYIEHVGMSGNTPNGATRSIVADTRLGQLVSFTLLHEPYHGVHHRHAGVTHAYLPRLADSLAPGGPDELPPFPSYRHALVHLLGQLRDPRAGGQWRTQ
jgi:fatty acid desaturase